MSPLIKSEQKSLQHIQNSKPGFFRSFAASCSWHVTDTSPVPNRTELAENFEIWIRSWSLQAWKGPLAMQAADHQLSPLLHWSQGSALEWEHASKNGCCYSLETKKKNKSSEKQNRATRLLSVHRKGNGMCRRRPASQDRDVVPTWDRWAWKHKGRTLADPWLCDTTKETSGDSFM